MRTITLALLAALACTLALAGPALGAGTAAQALADCNAHDRLTQHYPTAVLRTALSTMPAEVKEYTDCYDVIQRQLLSQEGQLKGSGSGGSGGSLLPTWVIVVVAILVVGGAGFGALALRRRQPPAGPPAPPEE